MRKYVFFCTVLFLSQWIQGAQGEGEKPKLTQFKYNVYSQFGEDGIIEQIFNRIGTQSKTCIEFGAWDAFHLSNTARLFSQEGWNAVLIESDPSKFRALVNNVSKYSCKCLCEAVGIGKQSLESILERYQIPYLDIDLLSIDIDGNDYHVFESLEKMRPRVIICEHNPTLPAHLDIYSNYDPENCLGCSVGALVRLANQKKYTLVAITDSNAFFVKNEEIALFEDIEISLEKIKIDRYLHYYITDYKGRYSVITPDQNINPYGKNGLMTTPILGDVRKLN